jgi:copper transport protein
MSDRASRGVSTRPVPFAGRFVGLVAGLVGALLLVVGGGGPASAHSILEGSSPASGEVVQQAPTSVVLTFSEAVTLLPDSVRVFGPDGARVDDGHVGHAHDDAATASVGLRGRLAQGTYLVAYRIVSADSHPVSGAYTFSLGHTSQPPTTAGIASGPVRSVDVALGLGRWLAYAGSALGLGAALFLSWCWPAGWRETRARRVVNAGVLLLTLGTTSTLLLKGPYDAGTGLADALDGHLLREVLGTTYGRALDARLLLIAALILLLTYRDRVSDRVLRLSLSGLLPVVGITFALCGHAAAGSYRPVAIVSDTLHVTAMSLWLGGLVVLLAVVLRGADDHDVVATPARRFSRVAAGAVGVLVVTGIYQALREVTSWDVLSDTHYGHVLLVKIGIVAVALFAAAGSRAWAWQSLHPVAAVAAMTEASPMRSEGTPPPARLRRTVAVETAALLGVLVASSLLVTSDPARAVAVPTAVSSTQRVGNASVRVSAVPDGARAVSVRIQVLGTDGRPLEPRELDASLSLAAHDVGPLPVTLTRASTGVRTGHASVPFAGTWRLAVTVRTSAIDEATAYVEIPIA